MQFLRVSRGKNWRFFPAGPSFLVLQMTVYRSALIPRKHLHAFVFLYEIFIKRTFPVFKFLQQQSSEQPLKFVNYTLECLIDTPPPRTWFFFTQNILIPTTPSINYWGKFSIQTNFLKQYTNADFFPISLKERHVCSVFCFASSFKKPNTLFCFVS